MLVTAGSPAHPDPWPVALAHPEEPNSSADCEPQNLPHLLPREEPADRNHKRMGNSCLEPVSASKGRAAQWQGCKRGSGLPASSMSLANSLLEEQPSEVGAQEFLLALPPATEAPLEANRLSGASRTHVCLFQHL